MIRFIIITFTFLITHAAIAQYTILPSSIKWYDIEQALKLNKKEARPIIIDVYTDWCSWCNYMMKTSFTNKGIANYINENFYAVRLNAESLDTIEFKGRKYFNRNVGRKPTHDLASILLEGKLSYPSIVYFDINGNKYIKQGFKEPKDIEPTLVYMVENLADNIPLSEFTINFMFTYPAAFEKDHSIFNIPRNQRPDTLGKQKWIKPKEINIQSKKKRKPFMIFFQSDLVISSKVMEKTTFGNKNISTLLNKNFKVIKFNLKSQDTISFMGKTYTGTGKNNPHQLAHYILKNKLKMPAVAFFDEKGKLLIKINGYLNVRNLETIIQFFNEKKYQTITYNEYLKSLKTSNNSANNLMK